MIAICPNCRKRVRFSFWRIDAMKLQCPVCHSFVFKQFGIIEVFSVIGALGTFGLAVSFLELSWYKMAILAIGLIAVLYLIRLFFIWVHRLRNENIY